MFKLIVIVIIVIGAKPSQASWFDAEQLELFDLVEEVKQNFYEFMELNEVKNLQN